MRDETTKLLEISKTPDVDAILEEFRRAGGLSGASVQRQRNNRIRDCLWDGRTSDYKKHRSALNAEPVPWENAWDGRIYLADGVIDDLGDVLTNAFKRAQLSARPTEAGDMERAGLASVVLAKYRDKMEPVLSDEAQLLWQWGLTYGASMWQVGWDRQVALKEQVVTLDALQMASAQAYARLTEMGVESFDSTAEANDLMDLAELPALIGLPEQEERAAKALQLFARELARALFSVLPDIEEDSWLTNYKLPATDARAAVRELREEGEAEFPAPYVRVNQPFMLARQSGYDYFAPPEMTGVQTSPWHAVRDWLTPEQILEKVVVDGWDEDWAQEAIKTKGMTSTWGDPLTTAEYAVDSESEAGAYSLMDTKSGLVEVIWFFKRYVDARGIPQIWVTVFSPAVTEDDSGGPLYAVHEPTNDAHGKYPFVEYRWRKKQRNYHDNVGIPELIGADQQSVKRSTDMLVDRQELEVNPPWLVANRLAMRYKAGPGAQIPRKRKDDFEPAPPPSGSPDIAFNLIELVQKRISAQFGLINEYVLPAKWQAKLQRLAERYLASCSAAFTMVLQLIQQYASDVELERLAEGASNFPRSVEEIQGQYDITLTFAVQDLDPEFVWKKLEALTKWAVPLDRAGVIDMANLAKLIVLAIDPTYSKVLIQTPEQAGQKMFREVQNDIALMMLGNEAQYVENDPAAEIKLQFAQQVIASNPRAQQAAQQDQLFQQNLEKYFKNLQQSVSQEQNKQVGRLGVQPGPAAAA